MLLVNFLTFMDNEKQYQICLYITKDLAIQPEYHFPKRRFYDSEDH